VNAQRERVAIVFDAELDYRFVLFVFGRFVTGTVTDSGDLTIGFGLAVFTGGRALSFSTATFSPQPAAANASKRMKARAFMRVERYGNGGLDWRPSHWTTSLHRHAVSRERRQSRQRRR
jgi:hypothetical protein